MLSEQYFKSTTWPSVESIESMIPNGDYIENFKWKIICLPHLYLEFIFRINEVYIFDPLQGNVLSTHLCFNSSNSMLFRTY